MARRYGFLGRTKGKLACPVQDVEEVPRDQYFEMVIIINAKLSGDMHPPLLVQQFGYLERIQHKETLTCAEMIVYQSSRSFHELPWH